MIGRLVATLEDAPVREVSIFRHSVFVHGPCVGLASTVNTGGCMQPLDDCGRLHQRSTRELARLIFADQPLARAVGMAAINAVVNRPELVPAEDTGDDKDAFEYIVANGKGKNIAVIGHFPKVDWLRKSGMFENFWVFELNPRGDDLGPEDYGDYLPRADFVLLTATSIINGTFNDMVSLCRNSYNVLVGPSSPLHPLLFEYGIDCIAGSVVVDPDRARVSLSQGASYRHAEGLRRFARFRPDVQS
jgi:hypothetical protein